MGLITGFCGHQSIIAKRIRYDQWFVQISRLLHLAEWWRHIGDMTRIHDNFWRWSCRCLKRDLLLEGPARWAQAAAITCRCPNLSKDDRLMEAWSMINLRCAFQLLIIWRWPQVSFFTLIKASRHLTHFPLFASHRISSPLNLTFFQVTGTMTSHRRVHYRHFSSSFRATIKN